MPRFTYINFLNTSGNINEVHNLKKLELQKEPIEIEIETVRDYQNVSESSKTKANHLVILVNHAISVFAKQENIVWLVKSTYQKICSHQI